jgi:diguanylate cyclase (GGDEF)-like protein
MIAARIPRNETARLAALRSTGLLGTPDQYSLDCITNIGAKLFGVPVCTVSLVDENQQWFKSRVGLTLTRAPRSISFCAHVVATALPLVIEDTLRDVRFADNPLVTHAPRIRFYAGIPLHAESGEVLGTLCLIDSTPRAFPGSQLRLLRELAGIAQLAVAVRRNSAPPAAPVSELEVHRRESMLDARLGIWNRAGITAILGQQLCITSLPCATAMVAIDRLTALLDIHGPAAGEITLKTVLRELRSILRPEHEIGHYCEDRFLVVLPGTTGASAEQLARRMSDAIALLSIDIPGDEQTQPVRLGCTVSISVATWHQTAADSSQKLIGRANAALASA